MKKGTLPLVAILFAVIILSGTVFISASPGTSEPYEAYDKQDAATAAVAMGLFGGAGNPEWMNSLDKVIPPEERERLMSADPSELTTAHRLVRDFLIRLSSDGQISNSDWSFSDVDMTAYESFVEDFVENERKRIFSQRELFDREKLNIKVNATKKEVKDYGNTVGEIIARNSFESDHEIHIFKRLTETGARSDELDLLKISAGYKKIAKEASLVVVPVDAVDIHLDFINNMKRVGTYIEKMARVTEDPVMAMISFNEYFDMTGLSLETMKRVAEYFDQKEIFYEKHESGYAYTIIKHLDLEKEFDEFMEKIQ